MDIDQIENKAYYLGVSVGWEDASKHILEAACLRFKADDDDAAQDLKDLARELMDKADEKRRVYDNYKAKLEGDDDQHRS